MRRRLAFATFFALVLAASLALAGGKVNVNAAGASELASVPGIDARLAARIVAYRAAHGPFKSRDELLRVPGFTKLTMVKALDYIDAGPAPNARHTGPVRKRVDLNRASFAELLLVPEMTPRMAKGIVDYRDRNGPFKKISELQRVPDMDKVKLVKILNHVKVVPLDDGPVVAATPRPTPTPVVSRPTPSRPNPTPVAVAAVPTVRTHRTPRRNTPRPADTPAVTDSNRIDLNGASVEELMELPRMTRDAAREVIAWRDEHGPFRRPRDLVQVPLFGEAAYDRLKDYIEVR